MKILTMYGASDDLIEAAGIGDCDAFSADGDPSAEVQGRFQVLSSEGQLEIFALYPNTGCWSFAVSQIEDDVALPDWPIRVSQYNKGFTKGGFRYSTLLEINCPDDARLIRIPQGS